jgi:hypothetical protein
VNFFNFWAEITPQIGVRHLHGVSREKAVAKLLDCSQSANLEVGIR